MAPDHARSRRVPGVLADNPLLIGVALIGFAVSFQTVARLAVRHGLPGWPPLYPLGLDVGIMALITESRHLIRLGRSDTVPRALAWLLTGFTVYANVHGSPPHDWVGRALHAAMPCLWVACLELTRRRMIASEAVRREGVPLARWVLAPWPTFLLYRRMVLWQVTSYALALEREQLRRRAMATLKARHGGKWRRLADSAVVWQLRHGIDVEGASGAVSALGAGPARREPGADPEPSPEDRAEATPQARPGARSQAGTERATAPALKLAANRSRGMSATDLVPHVSAMLGAYGSVSQARVKRDLHVSTPKAAEALRLARHERVVVPMGARGKG